MASAREGASNSSSNASFAAFDRSPMAVCIHCDGKVVYANTAFVRLLGASNRTDIEGHPTVDFFRPDLCPRLESRVKAPPARTDSPPFQDQITRRDRGVLVVDITAWPISWTGTEAIAMQIVPEAATASVDVDAPTPLSPESCDIGTWDHNLETGEMNWSEGQYRIHGLEPVAEAPSYRLWQGRVHPQDIGRVEMALENARRYACDFDVDYRTVWPDGSIHWINARGHCFHDAAGRPVRMTAVFAPVESRGEIEDRVSALKKELEQRVEDFEALFHLMPVGLALARDPECRDVRVNPELARILGMHIEQNASKSGAEADRLPFRLLKAGQELAPEDLPQQKAQATGRTVGPVELEVVRNDGVVRYMYGSAVPLFAGDGNVRGSIAAYVDITERRRVENSLRDAMQRLETHLRNSPLAVIEFGPDFNVIRWSEAAERMFGWTAAEITGRRIDELRWVHEEDMDTVKRRSEEMACGRDFRIVGYNRNYRKDGSMIHCEWYNSALLDEFGRLKSVLSLVLDVTERKRAEERLSLQARQLAATNQELQQFAHMTSHDLQEPLRTVLAFSELIRRKSDDSSQKEYLGVIIDAAARMHRLIENLLQFARVGEPGDAAKSRISMSEVLEEVKSNLRTAIADSGAEIICSDLPAVVGLRDDLVRLMQNLVANAIKYHRDGVRPRIRIDVGTSGTEYVFGVEDNGEGFDPSKADEVFAVFRRLHRHKEKGTGLGLAICKKIVEKHGGRIWAEAAPGVGAKFSFTLPRS